MKNFRGESMKYHVYGGHSGLVVQALFITADEVRERFQRFMDRSEEGAEFRVECAIEPEKI